jgi:hypothetical protein
MKTRGLLLSLVLLFSLNAFADKPQGKLPPGQAKKSGLTPGLAKKNGLPPGLAKKLGATGRSTTYIAVDPDHDDRVWVLSGGQWRLRQGFDDNLRGEVRQLLGTPATAPISPPVPLPNAITHLRVMVFTP